MGKMYDTVKERLDELEYHYNVDDSVFRMGVRGENTNMNVTIITDEDKELFMVNVALPQKAVETRMVEVIKWVNHFNFWCVLGVFMVDDRDGEIVFRITETMDEGAINKSIVDACLSTAMCTADNAYPDLIKAMFHEEEQIVAPATEELPAEEIARFSHSQFNS